MPLQRRIAASAFSYPFHFLSLHSLRSLRQNLPSSFPSFPFVEFPLQSPQIIGLQPTHPRPTFPAMFDTITAELTTATDKLDHLRRFL
jgi:hypothetical protein